MTCSLSNVSGDMTHTLLWQNLALGSLVMEMDMQIHQWLWYCSVPWGSQVSNACTWSESSCCKHRLQLAETWEITPFSEHCAVPCIFHYRQTLNHRTRSFVSVNLPGMARSSPCQSATPLHLHWFGVWVVPAPQNKSIATLAGWNPWSLYRSVNTTSQL